MGWLRFIAAWLLQGFFSSFFQNRFQITMCCDRAIVSCLPVSLQQQELLLTGCPLVINAHLKSTLPCYHSYKSSNTSCTPYWIPISLVHVRSILEILQPRQHLRMFLTFWIYRASDPPHQQLYLKYRAWAFSAKVYMTTGGKLWGKLSFF